MSGEWGALFNLIFSGFAYVQNSFNGLFCLSVAFGFVTLFLNFLRQLLYRRVGE